MRAKRIVFKSSPNGPCLVDDIFVEKLTVTPNTISYDWKLPPRTHHGMEEISENETEWARHRKWFYKTNHPKFYEDFNCMAEKVKNYIRNGEEVIYPCDGASYEIVLTLEDGTKIAKDVGVNSDILDECHALFINWLPPQEVLVLL